MYVVEDPLRRLCALFLLTAALKVVSLRRKVRRLQSERRTISLKIDNN